MIKMTVVKIGPETNCHQAKWILLEFFFLKKILKNHHCSNSVPSVWGLFAIMKENHVSRNSMQHIHIVFLWFLFCCCGKRDFASMYNLTIKLNVFESMHETYVMYFYLVTLNVWYLNLVHCNGKHYFWNAYYDGIINIT